MKKLMTGNEALARGAYEAGVKAATGYPGTPSSEILENIVQYKEIYAEWSTNEKTATEAAIGATYAGRRAITTMKQVGMNVAADAFFFAVYTGMRAGLMIIVADDPGMFSSQNEQDNRHYAPFAKMPMLEPADAQEALEFARLAFELSERHDTPVLLRVTTRLAHSDGVVITGEREQRPPNTVPTPEAEKYVMIPARARARRRVIADAVAHLDRNVAIFLPGAVDNGRFCWELLCGLDGADPDNGAQALATQHISVNVDPSDRYVQAVPGSDRYRLRPDESGYDNLVVCGDWTDCGINAGCIEAAVISGLQAANALLGHGRHHRIRGFYMP